MIQGATTLYFVGVHCSGSVVVDRGSAVDVSHHGWCVARLVELDHFMPLELQATKNEATSRASPTDTPAK